MGYCISQRDCDFRIKAENIGPALAAIKALATDTDSMRGFSSRGGEIRERWYSWVRTEDFANAETLADAMYAWRWEIDYDPKTTDVNWIMFHGEKLGQDDIMLQAIAPFVENGSYIEMQGECGAIWRYVFQHGKMEEKEAIISWQ